MASFPMGASTREAYGKTLVQLGRENPDIVVLDADLSTSTQTIYFAREFPDRFFNVGLAEQNLIGISAGLAASGKTVFASSFAVFATGRCFDQIRVSIAQPHLNVKVVASHAGISVGEDGASHQAIEDLALMCSLPGFTVVVPADEVETPQAIRASAATPGPFYVRCGRPKVPVVYPPDYHFVPGKAAVMREGQDVTIVANGLMLAAALEAAAALEREGVDALVLSMPTVKPVDTDALVSAARVTGAVVVAEEHLLHGGLGSVVAQVLAERHPVPVGFVALRDTYAESGKPDELLAKYGLTAEDIRKAALATLNRKVK
ncbi:MAG TPA: transketolase C-terminal domain-containing protein [Dehalococcoidia bacterium]|nr:transketolase C-terminal domain-containing protein [Dehalococcoidia bacterium]